jgi:hypothetical protein
MDRYAKGWVSKKGQSPDTFSSKWHLQANSIEGRKRTHDTLHHMPILHGLLSYPRSE